MCWWTSACWHLPRTARMTGQYQRLLREYVQEFQLPALPIHFDMVPHVNWFLIFYILCFLWSSKSWHVTSLHEWCVHQEWRVSIIGKSKSLYWRSKPSIEMQSSELVLPFQFWTITFALLWHVGGTHESHLSCVPAVNLWHLWLPSRHEDTRPSNEGK